MPQRTWPSTSIPSTSNGSGKRSETNGSVRRALGSASAAHGRSEHADDLSLLRDPLRPGLDASEERVNEPAGRLRLDRVEARQDGHRAGLEPDLLVGLA